MALTVSSEGLEIPEKYRDADKLVIRTPSTTIDLSSGVQMMINEGVFRLIKPDHFDENEDLENPELKSDSVSIKEYGEEEETFEIEIIENE